MHERPGSATGRITKDFMNSKTSLPSEPPVRCIRLVRLALLRLLISWWMIPAVWLIVLPIGWLLSGNIAFRDCCYLSKAYWEGD